jgi:hypothetical protein
VEFARRVRSEQTRRDSFGLGSERLRTAQKGQWVFVQTRLARWKLVVSALPAGLVGAAARTAFSKLQLPISAEALVSNTQVKYTTRVFQALWVGYEGL